MRVGFDCAPLALNAAGERRYALSLMRALAARPDVELAPLTLFARRPGSFRQRLAWQAAAEGLYYPLMIGRRARSARVDLVHHPRHLVPPEIGLRVPSVVTVHDVLALTHPQYFSQLIARRFAVLARSSTHRADVVLTGSAYSREAIVERLGLAPEKVRVTPYAVDARFTPVEPDRDQLRAVTGVEGPYVLCLGTLEPRKNLAGAIRAWERVGADFPGHSLVVAGGRGWKSGPLAELLRTTRARVHVTGFVADEHLPLLYSGADCFLFPSFGEGFGFPVLEAMACGTPVVTSPVTSLPELAGDAAVMADPASTEALASALAGLLGSAARRGELAAAGLRRSARFGWDETAERTVEVYRELAA